MDARKGHVLAPMDDSRSAGAFPDAMNSPESRCEDRNERSLRKFSELVDGRSHATSTKEVGPPVGGGCEYPPVLLPALVQVNPFDV